MITSHPCRFVRCGFAVDLVAEHFGLIVGEMGRSVKPELATDTD